MSDRSNRVVTLTTTSDSTDMPRRPQNAATVTTGSQYTALFDGNVTDYYNNITAEQRGAWRESHSNVHQCRSSTARHLD